LKNPIIPGFHPDPSICRAGGDYFLVTSSFEYFPGVPIHHSRDLVNWRQIGHCLTRKSQLFLEGAPSSGGVYAPTIRHHDGRFYMVTTNVARQVDGRVEEGGNFYVSTDDPAGEWSEPIWVKQRGIDPSLYFEGEKTYFTSNGTAWAASRGLYQCEIDIRTGEQLNDTVFLWPGTGGAYVEAPHLFKRGNYYYLMAAEGGTERCHMETVARSSTPYGPFEPCPHNPILTHRSLPTLIQSTGHADFVEDLDGNWWAVFLGVRFPGGLWSNLGRETFLAPVTWTADGWPIVNGGQRIMPDMESEHLPPSYPWPALPIRDDFDSPKLGFQWVFLRNPLSENWSLTERPGSLKLRCARATLNDLESPAFLARRQEHFDAQASTAIDFSPRTEHDEAGISVYQNDSHHSEAAITLRGGRRVAIVRRRIGTAFTETISEPIGDGLITLFIQIDKDWYTFALTTAAGQRVELARHETRYLSTEVAGGFVGVMLGMYATARGTISKSGAYFEWFEYQPKQTVFGALR